MDEAVQTIEQPRLIIFIGAVYSLPRNYYQTIIESNQNPTHRSRSFGARG